MGIISLAPFPFMVKVGLNKRVASIFARLPLRRASHYLLGSLFLQKMTVAFNQFKVAWLHLGNR